VKPNNPNTRIWYTEFDNAFKMRNGLVAYLAKYVASTEYKGLLVAFSVIANDPSSLRGRTVSPQVELLHQRECWECVYLELSVTGVGCGSSTLKMSSANHLCRVPGPSPTSFTIPAEDNVRSRFVAPGWLTPSAF
jgi:hypothetical protein